MAIYPSQERTIDPFDSYNSNVVNRLTRMISNHENCLFSAHAIDVSVDSTSSSKINILPGQGFKDDVLIEIDEINNVDLSDNDYFLTSSSVVSSGYHYVCLEYTYLKAKPAPVARVRILRPSVSGSDERILYSQDSTYLFLKCMNITYDGGTGTYSVDSLYDYDPENLDNKREFAPMFAGSVPMLPTFVRSEHEARIVYVQSTKTLWWGTDSRWEEFSSIRDVITTTGCTVGQLGYLASDGTVLPAIATSENTLAECSVLQVGIKSDGSGQVRLYGLLEGVPVESGRTIQVGETCYLSDIEEGTATDSEPLNFQQNIGVAISDSTSGLVDIWFSPSSGGTSSSSASEYNTYQDLLLTSKFERVTIDTFSNLELIDTVNTTVDVLYQSDRTVAGENGDILQTLNLRDDDADRGYDGTAIVFCQLSTTGSDEEYQSWYVTNNGGDSSPDWFPLTLDEVYHLPTLDIPTFTTAVFEINDIITGQTSGHSAVVNYCFSDKVSVNDNTGNFINGEILVASDGTTSVIIDSDPIERIGIDYTDLRLKCEFSGDSIIEDYGLLYELNTNYINDIIPNNKFNIETLYSDLYESPSQDDDGIANLTTPIETCKNNLQTFTGSISDVDVTPPYTSEEIIGAGNPDLTTAMSTIDEFLNNLSTYKDNIQTFIGSIGDVDTTPPYTSEEIIGSGNPDVVTAMSIIDEFLNNLSTYKDNLQTFTGSVGDIDITPPYTSEEIIGAGNPNLTTAMSTIDEFLNNLSTYKDNLQTFVGSIGDTDTTPPYTSELIIGAGNPDVVTAISSLDEEIYKMNRFSEYDVVSINSAGVLTVSQDYSSYTVSSYDSTSDIIMQIEGMTEGQIIRLTASSGHTLTLEAGTYLKLGGGINFSLDGDYDLIELECVNAASNICRATIQQSNG